MIGAGFRERFVAEDGREVGVRVSGAASEASAGPQAGENKKWSLLSRLPLLPKYFSSEWSAAHSEFEGGGRAAIGWVAEDAVVVVSVGGGKEGMGEARWEKFVLVEAASGGEECLREGWRRYLDND